MKRNYLFLCSLCLMLLVSMTANAGIRKWDFTKWSEATVADLLAGSDWSDIEKSTGTAPTDLSKDNCFWEVTAMGNASGEVSLTANGNVIKELEGLWYTNTTNRSLAIAVNYQNASATDTTFKGYHGPSYLWLGSKKQNYFVIPNVKPGASIKMGVESHKQNDARGVELYIGRGTSGTKLLAPDGTTNAIPTTYQDFEWLVPENATDTPNEDGTFDIQIYNTNGCHIYYIEVIEYPESAIATLTHTASSSCNNNKEFTSTVDAENEHINNSNFNGIWAGAAYAEFGVEYPKNATVTKATLKWSILGSGKNRNTDLLYVSEDTCLNYTAEGVAPLAAGNTKVNLPAEFIATVSVPANTTTAYTQDVTAALQKLAAEGRSNVIFKFTNNAGGGDLKGKGSDAAPVLEIETTSAPLYNYYIKFVDAEGNVLKDSVENKGLAGNTVKASAEHLAAFKNEAGDKKYIYVSGNDPIVIDADESKNVINLVFREAAIWNYTVVAKDADGNVLNEAAVKGTNFEGETFNLGYPRYALSNGQLYEAGKLSADKKGYYMSTTLDQDNYVLNVSYAKKEADSTVVYYEEAENFNSYSIGLLTTANAGIRASAGKAAYAKYDISLTSLKAGKYEIVAGLFDAAKTATYVADFAINGDTVATLAATAVNLSEVSAEINIAANNTRLSWLKSGNENKGLDYVYIKRIGDEDYTEVASIADVKNAKTGTPVALKLTDVKLTYSTKDSTCTNPYGYGYMEDATDGIGLDYSALDSLGWQSGNILNGTLYAIAKTDYYGRPVLTLAGKTPKSDVTLTPAENTPAEATVAQLSNTLWQKNYGKLFVLKDVKWGKAKINDYTTNYYLISGEDSIRFKDDMYVLPENMPAYEKFNSIQGYVNIGYDGDVVFNCNGVYDAVVTPATRVANIAALKDIESGTDVLLTLDNAIVTVMQTGHSGNLIILEDKTGGIQMSAGNYYGEGGLANALGIDNDSTSITGDLYCRYTNSYGTIMISENDSTAASNVTVKTGVAVNPTVVTLADITTGNYDMRLVKIKNLGMTYDAEMYQAYLVSGETSVAVYDMFGTMMDENWQTIIVENLKSITGITIPATDYQPCSFAPLSYVEKKYKTFTENTVMLMTADNVAAAIAEGWAEGGDTRVDNKKGNVDPATGALLDSPQTFEGVGLKSGNSAKTFAVDVTGIEQVIGYGASTSSKDTRTLKITATDADATTVSAEGTTAPNTTAVVKLDLDKTKAYTIEFTGLNADGTAGADIALHGIKFVYDSIALGISEVNTQSPNLGNIYNLNGIMVRKAGESLQGLEKGIYIINNKKVVVK